MVICLERGADLHMAQLMPLPLTVSCFSKIQIGFTYLVPAHPGSPGKRAVKRVCVRACVCVRVCVCAPAASLPAARRRSMKLALRFALRRRLYTPTYIEFAFRRVQGCIGAGEASPTFFDRGDAFPTPHFFGLKFMQKLIHCCNWLLTET